MSKRQCHCLIVNVSMCNRQCLWCENAWQAHMKAYLKDVERHLKETGMKELVIEIWEQENPIDVDQFAKIRKTEAGKLCLKTWGKYENNAFNWDHILEELGGDKQKILKEAGWEETVHAVGIQASTQAAKTKKINR